MDSGFTHPTLRGQPPAGDRLGHGSPARVVTVSSNAQAIGRIDFEDLQGARSYSGARAYNQSKLANVLFSYELAFWRVSRSDEVDLREF